MVWPKASTLHHIVKIWHGPRSQGKQSHSYRHDNPRACILPSRTRGHRLDLFGSKVKSFATHKKIMVIQNWVFGKYFLENKWIYSRKTIDQVSHQWDFQRKLKVSKAPRTLTSSSYLKTFLGRLVVILVTTNQWCLVIVFMLFLQYAVGLQLSF